MSKYYSGLLGVLVMCVLMFGFSTLQAQTITINNIDPGPYTPGSTVAVQMHVDYTSGCVAQNNVYNLYLSDASGSFAAKTLIGTTSGFYAQFINGTIPAGTPAGVGYRLRVESTQPAVVSAASSNAIVIAAGSAVNAILYSASVSSQYPEVYGSCDGQDGTNYSFSDGSTFGSQVTATFFNEQTQANETSVSVNGGFTFKAQATNYSIIVKAWNGSSIATKGYVLINNNVNSTIASTGNNSVCLTDNKGTIVFNIPTERLKLNYPGNTYMMDFGDGSSVTLTECEIEQLNGNIAHTYTHSSCGMASRVSNNAYEVKLQAMNQFCGGIGTSVTTSAKVFDAPYNKITAPVAACTADITTFKNDSYPGQNPNNTGTDCLNDAATYTWSVDGRPIVFNAKIGDNFQYKFTTPGQHTITLDLNGGTSACSTASVSTTVCVQNPPQPQFTVSAAPVCLSNPITPVNTSVIDANCNIDNTYNWKVTGPAPITYAGGTSAASQQPQFVFSTPGVYQITVSITTASCGVVTSNPQTLYVDGPPVNTLSPDAQLCGKGQTLSFNIGTGPTQTTFSGTAQAAPDTYTWEVSGGNYSFANGTTANSQYPQILFTDYAAYTVKVTQNNACGSTSSTQHITFQEAPTVTAGSDQHICSGDVVTLNGSAGTVNSYQWVGGTGTFSPSRNVLNPTYTPSADEIKAGNVTLVLQAKTSLAAPCNTIESPVTIFIAPTATVTSASTLAVCTNQALNYTITGSQPGSTFTWTAAVTSGSATGFTASGSGNTINDIINVTGNTNAVITYTIIPNYTSSSNEVTCPGQPFTLTVTASPLPVATATVAEPLICSSQPANINLSSNVSGTSYTWASTSTGTVTGNSTQTVPIAATNIADLLTNTGTDKAIVTYSITPYNGSCPGTPFTATVTVQPLPVTANAGGDDEVCNVTTYTLKGNNPSPGTGKWTVSLGQTGVTFSDATKPDATVSGLIPGNTYKFTWTITAAPTCPPSANTVTIIDDPASNGGTTTGSASVCGATNSGTITLAGSVGAILNWESSTDGGTTWTPIINTTTNQTYLNLPATTQYRAVVKSGTCSIAYSTVSTITVSASTVAANAGRDQPLCDAKTATLNAVNPAPFTGIWTQTSGPLVTIVDPGNYQTQVTGLSGGNSYKFTWTVKGLPPCSDIPDEMVIIDSKDIIPSFTASPTTGCGPVNVNFTNTSLTSTTTSFSWDFGDGSAPSTALSPSHQFQPRTDGKDTTYIVSLNVVNNCAVHPPATVNITVSPAVPVAEILPLSTSGCSPFTLTVKNVSPGTNKSYDFYLYDGSTLLQKITKTDKSDVSFAAVSPTAEKNYSVYMIATNNCGTTKQSLSIPINVSPARFVPQFISKNNITKGCYPLSVTFQNNTSGGTQYYYNIYDASGKLISKLVAGRADFDYTFPDVGDYSVSITGIDNCTPTGLESGKTSFHVYAVPQPAFKGNQLSACSTLSVSFTNQTPADASGTPATSLSYIWDFGDGTQSTQFSPTHLYTKPGNYTVSLTAFNAATTCTNSVTQSGYITVTAPPLTDFRVQPDTITTIPNYSFTFTDESTGSPVSWRWTFGDGSASSTAQNPSHTYADTGRYTVTLTTTNSTGCSSVKIRHVAITGVPGQLFVPNAFMPNSATTELRTFMAKGSGIKTYHLQIFNNWGQLIWETTKLSSRGEPIEGWDGTFKGEPVPQGVYVWQMSATFINGNEWKGMSYNNSSSTKHTGPIHLLR